MSPASATAGAPPAPRWSMRRLWLLALPLAGLWFGFWGLLWQPQTFTLPSELPRFTPHARFLPARTLADGGEPQSDLRVMWSPVLFALPTPMGFSRAPAAGDGHDRPRVQRPNLEPQLMPPPTASLKSVVPASKFPGFNDGANFRLDGAEPVFAAMPAATNSLTTEILGGLRDTPCLEKPLPALPPELISDSWAVAATLEVGREGRVQHVFLDPPSASAAFNVQLTQAFFRWRFAPSSAAAQGVVHLHHVTAPKAPQPAPKETAP